MEFSFAADEHRPKESVNSSSSVLLQKLDLTQQDLLKQSKAAATVDDWVLRTLGCFFWEIGCIFKARLFCIYFIYCTSLYMYVILLYYMFYLALKCLFACWLPLGGVSNKTGTQRLVFPLAKASGEEWIIPRNCWTPGVSWSSWICRHEPRWLVKGFLGCGKCWHRWQAEKFRCQFRDGVFWLVKCCDVMRFHSEWLKILLNITSNHPFYPSLPIHSLLDRSDMDLSSVFPTCPMSCPPFYSPCFFFFRCLI